LIGLSPKRLESSCLSRLQPYRTSRIRSTALGRTIRAYQSREGENKDTIAVIKDGHGELIGAGLEKMSPGTIEKEVKSITRW